MNIAATLLILIWLIFAALVVTWIIEDNDDFGGMA
jgi:hypothetical protein